ncbi:hypothetical protein PVAP13_4NG215654 [Panicum virgatum]|uniref:Cytochrome P450 n=1 Tax=Panicum virgatum TaxID=38727 RepID=A0A8T0TDY6_PANVG|nr:hypothetical protein PVAP13_4NG215654 [Panicum virgatum]
MDLSSPQLVLPVAVLLVPFFYFFIKYKRSQSLFLPVKWPIVGILPAILANLNNAHDYITLVLSASSRNFKVHGPLATSMQFFFTSDPRNVRHIFTSNHAKLPTTYPKGEEFAEAFDIMRGSFFTVDGEPCRRHRAKIQSILSNPRVLALIACSCRDKVESGLLPFLARMADAGAPFDMQLLNTRYAFDVTATPVFGADPGLLPPAMPPLHVTDAMDTVMEVPFLRHAMPAFSWKVMRRLLGIGPERRLAAAKTVLREFVAKMMEMGRKQQVVAHGGVGVVRKQEDDDDEEAPLLNIQSSCIDDPDYGGEVLHATLINYLVAGRDTVGTGLSWLWYSIATNPSVLLRIRWELEPTASRKAGTKNKSGPDAMVTFAPEETKELVYLHAAVFEALRLHPPAPIERKTALGDDTLPSGHEVRAGDTILISLYAMARMESVWGGDCREYRPERWLSVSRTTGASCSTCLPTSSWPSARGPGVASARTSG